MRTGAIHEFFVSSHTDADKSQRGGVFIFAHSVFAVIFELVRDVNSAVAEGTPTAAFAKACLDTAWQRRKEVLL